MLPRILETEVMDTREEASDYDAMDHSSVNRAFVEDFLSSWNGQGRVLDVGTGTAQIPLELCRQSPTATIVAVDLAQSMLCVAEKNIRKARLDTRIHLQLADAKILPFPAGFFGAVMSNSIIHHIPRPGVVFKQMIRATRPGGLVFVRDLLRPADEESLQHLVLSYAGQASSHQRQMFADSLHAALTVEEVRALISSFGFNPEEVRQTSDRHWTWQARKECQQ